MKSVGSVIKTDKGNYTVRESYNAGGVRVPIAFKRYKDILIRHKDLDYVFTNGDVYTDSDYKSIIRETNPIISKLMGANSVLDGKIVPLGELQTENRVFYMEGTYCDETTRFYLFNEKQAKQMGIDLSRPAFAVIEDGYDIVDGGKSGYAINTPEKALPNLRLFYGTFKSGELRYIEPEFFTPFGEIASFEAKNTRYFYYVKPGPAVRGIFGFLVSRGFDCTTSVYFGDAGGCYARPFRYGVLTAKVQDGTEATKAVAAPKPDIIVATIENMKQVVAAAKKEVVQFGDDTFAAANNVIRQMVAPFKR